MVDLYVKARTHSQSKLFYYAAIFAKLSFSLCTYYSGWMSCFFPICMGFAYLSIQGREHKFKMNINASKGDSKQHSTAKANPAPWTTWQRQSRYWVMFKRLSASWYINKIKMFENKCVKLKCIGIDGQTKSVLLLPMYILSITVFLA